MIEGDNTKKQYLLSGEIVEIHETGRNRFAKIKLNPELIDICIDKITDVHLNDNIIINASIYINSIIQNPEEINFL